MQYRGVLWNAAGVPTLLANVGGANHQATAINASGAVVGYPAGNNTGTVRSGLILWRKGDFTRLDAPVTGDVTATGINNAGQIVGMRAGVKTVFWQSDSAAVQTLPGLGGAADAARAINSTGVIVGFSLNTTL